ncbi:MAG: EamA family transporter RarD [Caldisericia bacterium]|nr:EamA family transporter RarD [Caldisericia bacterium]MDD4615401.1 EamA family transporter RarD [Caldisericia bacterium]
MKKQLSIPGLMYAIGSYIIWGVTPIFWKALASVQSFELMAYRILWSMPFLLLIILFSRKWKEFWKEIRQFSFKTYMLILLATGFLLINWCTFIWAVNNGFIVHTSLGYYINPIISILLGVIVLKESLTKLQWIAFALVTVGVLVLIYGIQSFPWISFTLAFSFGMYGMMKKKMKLPPITSLSIEMFIGSIVSVGYLVFLSRSTPLTFSSTSPTITILLIFTGAVTSIPLLMFNEGTQRLPLYWMGFLQYIAPTLSLMIGIFVYREAFSIVHFLAFCIIWSGLIVLSSSSFFISQKRVTE